MTLRNACGTSVLALVMAALAAPMAEAQVDEIIVTARKREERLQEVPIAVTGFSAEQIEALKPHTLKDLDALAPNLYIGTNTAGPSASAIFMRGLGYADIEKAQSPAVGVILDGIFLGTSTGQLIDAFDMQQVEISRGPQGLYEGKNTNAGVIKVTRSRPTMDWGFRGQASYGSYDEVILRGIVNVPIVKDQVGLKVGYTYKNRDGYWGNVYEGETRGDVEYTNLNAGLRAKLGERAEMNIVFDYIADRGEGIPVQVTNAIAGGGATFGIDLRDDGLPNGSNTIVSGNPYNLDVHQVLNDNPERSYYDVLRGSVEFVFDTDFGEIVSITGFMKSKDFVRQDFDGTCISDLRGIGCPQNSITAALDQAVFLGLPDGTFGPDIITPLGNPLLFPVPLLHTVRDQDFEQITQELRLDADITDELNLLVGVYYYEHEIGLTQLTDNGVLPGPVLAGLLGRLGSRQDTGEVTDSLSFFGALNWKVTPTLSISGGARWISEDKTFTTRFETGNGALGTGIPLVPPLENKDSWEDLVTKIGADWQITPNNLVYFSRSEGFRSGGFATRWTGSEQIEGQNNCVPDDGDAIPNELLCPQNDFSTYEPETIINYEIGSKNRFLDNQVTVNLAAFMSKVENYQAGFVVVTPGYGPGTNTYINNIQEGRIKGVELEAVLAPKFIPGLTIFGSAGYQDAKFKEAILDARRLGVGPGGQPGSGGLFDTLAAGGNNVFGFTPKYNYAIRGNYELPVFDGILNFNAGWRYTDDLVYGVFGITPDIEPGYGTLDAAVTYTWKNYELSFYGKNLLDKEYRFQSLPAVFFQGWGDPLIVAGQVSVNF